jgi:SAM-dependent methyltransferase
MTKTSATMNMANQDINKAFMEEYTSDVSVRRYTSGSAGRGISYLLDQVYGDLYIKTINTELKGLIGPEGIRVLEYGCGGGMNLITLVGLLKKNGIKIDKAIGTDFSPVLIEAARREAKALLDPESAAKIEFFVAKNEGLYEGFEKHFGKPLNELKGRLHLAIGVNTSRYCHRLKEEQKSTDQIAGLLMPGGISIMIDMNDKFPAFRSKLKNKRVTDNALETFIPPLKEYARPFKAAGLEILQERTFCWVPHSAGKMLCLTMRAMSPVLQTLFPARGMRSLVVSRKSRTAAR